MLNNPSASANHRLRLIVVVLMVLPWLWPYAGGPSPSVQPWLASAACAGMLWLWRAHLTPARVAAAWLAAALISSVLGLLQYFGAAHHFSPWIHPGSLGEAFANLRQRNQLATLTSIGLAAVLWWGAARAHQTRSVGRFLLVGVTVLLAVGNAASSSRTGLVQLLLLAGMFLLWGGWRQPAPRQALLLATLAYGAAALLLPLSAGLDPNTHGAVARVRTEAVDCGSRLVLWSNVLHLISLRPWLGWGWGELDYAHFITLYEGARFCAILDNAHNLPLHLAVELGMPAALVLCGAALWLFVRARPWREQDERRQLAWAVLGLICLHSLLEYPLWFGPFQLAVGLCIWVLWVCRRQDGTAGAPRVSQGGKRRDYAIALGLLAGTAYATWDYHRVSQIFLPPQARAAAYRNQTLEKIRDSWLFGAQVRFAEYTTTPLTRENAERLHGQGLDVLHYSPESRVVERLIASATLLGRTGEARYFQERFRAAYPDDYARWIESGDRVEVLPP